MPKFDIHPKFIANQIEAIFEAFDLHAKSMGMKFVGIIKEDGYVLMFESKDGKPKVWKDELSMEQVINTAKEIINE